MSSDSWWVRTSTFENAIDPRSIDCVDLSNVLLLLFLRDVRSWETFFKNWLVRT